MRLEKDNSNFEQTQQDAVEDTAQSYPKPTLRLYLAIGSLILLFNVSLGPYLCISSIITNINADLGPDPSYSWIASGWSVGCGTFLIIAGTISDLLGRRGFAIGTAVMAIISSILGVTAKSVGQGRRKFTQLLFHNMWLINCLLVIAANVFLGVNQAGALAGLAGMMELVPRKSRGIIIGISQATISFWAICGSLIGHSMAVNSGPGWRTAYWVTLAGNIVALVLVAVSYFPAKPLLAGNRSRGEILKTIDYVALLGILVSNYHSVRGRSPPCWLTTDPPTYRRDPRCCSLVSPMSHNIPQQADTFWDPFYLEQW